MASTEADSEIDLIVDANRFLKRERGTTIFTPAGQPTPRPVYKLYRRRGFWNTLRGALVRYRAEREFEHLVYLAEHDIACTAAVGWTHGYSPGHGFYELLATQRIEGAEDLETVILAGKRPDLGPLFAIVRRMHRYGFRHQALYARNVIATDVADAGRWKFYIADVPRSRIFPNDITGTRMALLDIVDLLASLRQAGYPPERIALDAWDFPARERARIDRMLARYSKARPWRILRDVECRCRHAAASAAALVSNLPLLPS